MNRTMRFLLALDVALGIGLFTGINEGEYISTYVYRKGYWRRVLVIDFFFLIFTWKAQHCQRSYEGQKKEGIVK